jgi:hypothetical protein
MLTLRKTIGTALVVVSLAGFAGSAFAATAWQLNHPRRAEVNARLANQNQRIRDEVREGEMSPARAAALHSQDRQIRREERFMASQHDGHITKPEQRALNQQLNGVSAEIGR